jgi:hypothetical protein
MGDIWHTLGLGPYDAGYLLTAAVWAVFFGVFLIDRRTSLTTWRRREWSNCAKCSGVAFVVIVTVVYGGPALWHLLGNLLHRI